MKKDYLYYIMYLFGSFIPLFVLFSHFNIVEDPIIIYILLVSVSIFTSLLSFMKHFKVIHILVSVILIMFLIINYESVMYAFIHIFNSIVKIYNSNNGISISSINIYINKDTIFTHVFIFVVVIQYFISNLVILLLNKRKFGRLFLFSLICSLPILLIQIKLNWIAWVLLIFYWLLIYVFNYFKNTINYSKIIKIPILILVVLSLTTSIFIENFSETKLKKYYNPVTIQQDLFDKFNEFLDSISKFQKNEHEVDLNSAKDRIYVNAKHLEVESSSIESMYLKYYSGDLYESNTWTSLKEENYEKYDNSLEKSFEWITKFTFNKTDVNEIKIQDFRKGRVFSIYPYYMRNVNQSYATYFDMYMKYSSNTATFQVWDIDKELVNSKKDYRYIEFIKENYLKIPDDIHHLFKYDLGFEDTNLHESTAKSKILSFLGDYTYTLSPGETPKDEDFVEYFLTKNKKGYCVHFASAATLMFRYYGIPARYVEGYHVSQSQFDSNGKAEVVDKNAHSWVEIFDVEYGWKPIEVTVGRNENDEIDDEPNRPTTPNQQNNQQNQNNTNQQNTQQNNPIIPLLPIVNDNKVDIKEIIFDYIYLFIMLGLFLIYFIYRRIRLKIKKNRLNQKNQKQSVYAMYNHLMKINNYKEVINNELIQLFEKNKYSKEGLDKDEYIYLKGYIDKISIKTYKELNLKQKIKYKFIDCLI